VPSAAARLAPVPPELDARVRDALESKGLGSLYVHQAMAWEAAAREENVIVTTGTASGKTLAFNLPVLDALARQPKTRALYLYPTKALAQDQARSLAALGVPGVRAAIYDGDTPRQERAVIAFAGRRVVRQGGDDGGQHDESCNEERAAHAAVW